MTKGRKDEQGRTAPVQWAHTTTACNKFDREGVPLEPFYTAISTFGGELWGTRRDEHRLEPWLVSLPSINRWWTGVICISVLHIFGSHPK